MSTDVTTLMTRNLHEVFGEPDADRRRKTIDEIFADDAVFYEQEGIHKGKDEIARIAGIIRNAHPDFHYTVVHPAEQLHDTAGRIQWTAGRPGEPPAYAGTDIIVARDGKIAAVYLFFDKQPA